MALDRGNRRFHRLGALAVAALGLSAMALPLAPAQAQIGFGCGPYGCGIGIGPVGVGVGNPYYADPYYYGYPRYYAPYSRPYYYPYYSDPYYYPAYSAPAYSAPAYSYYPAPNAVYLDSPGGQAQSYPQATPYPQQSQRQVPANEYYYCPDSGYYPSVQSCPRGWTRVIPNSPPPQ